MSSRIRVLLADDHAVVAEALRQLVDAQPDIDVTGIARTGLEAVRLTHEFAPDIVLMDVSMPTLNGIEAARRIHAECPRSRVVILSMHSDPEHVERAFRAGVSGYVLKRAAAREALNAIRAVHAGVRYLDAELTAGLLARVSSGGVQDPLARLSSRERVVLQLLAESHTVQSIAKQLVLSPKTIESYRARLMEKLDIHDLAGLVRFAVHRGLISLE